MSETSGLPVSRATRFRGRVWIFGDHISTDIMMPGSKVLARPNITPEEAAQHCMSANRPGWSAQVRKGDIIVAGRNFGCGSSRPAPRLLRTLGISVVVADSMSRLFFRNCIHLGFPALLCPSVSKAFEEGQMAEVDLETGTVVNMTTGRHLQGEALKCGTPPYDILRAGGLDSYLEQVLQERESNAGR